MFLSRETLGQLVAQGVGVKVNAPVTPTAGGGRPNAVQLDYGFTPVFDPASGSDSVALPAAKAGSWCVLFASPTWNNSATVWPKEGTNDTINNIADDPVDSPTGTGCILIFICVEDGMWWGNGILD